MNQDQLPLKQRLVTVKLITYAFSVSQIILLFVVYSVLAQQEPDLSQRNDMFMAIAVFYTCACLFGAPKFVEMMRRQSGKQLSWGMYLQSHLVGLVFRESAGIVTFVFMFMGAISFELGALLMLLVAAAIAMTVPKEDQVASMLKD